MENSVFDTPSANVKTYDIPLKWGVMIGIIGCLLTTIQNKFLLDNLIFYSASFFVSGLIIVILHGVAGGQQRKAFGGFISFGDVYKAIFITIVISVLISFTYSVIYQLWIDPSMTDKIKESSMHLYEKMNLSQEQLDEAVKKMDEQTAKSKSAPMIALSFVIFIAVYSIFGLISAAIVRRNRPVGTMQ